jgi:hypothetical protein
MGEAVRSQCQAVEASVLVLAPVMVLQGQAMQAIPQHMFQLAVWLAVY